uniref:Laminin EGF-like domain-containing protein n=1 Tax=Pipistrellus kuhlii TaxID=59472 RepID=A0A7J7WDN0_PIPKU|nr:hypothetical protein mPipKuh1_008104 [Pipistrellus kuhlii]
MLWSGGTAMDLLPPSDTQDSEHCFFCDSRDGDRGGHGIENVISWSGCHGNQTWWQAESGVENVTIQLDLESAFHFTHLVMTFKVIFHVLDPALLVENPHDPEKQECQCHGHARSCHFDMALYLASDNVSGGVCDACQHNTAGAHCELCQPFFHREPRADPRSLHSCKPCRCDPRGRGPGAQACDPSSGACRCKRFVSGPDCSRCLIVLLPWVRELPGLRLVDPVAAGRLQELHAAGCLEAARTGRSSSAPAACAHRACSISALLHGGGLACECHPQGSLSAECALRGGQCRCRPNVTGRTCDRCEPGTYGLGPGGCRARLPLRGRHQRRLWPDERAVPCWAGLAGRRCDRCLQGHWGFPRCQPCACNGHAEACHPLSGACQACLGATAGWHCERCLDGYYGDPALGSGQRCRPCLCPGRPGSGFYHGTSCHLAGTSGRVQCLCRPGYTGPHCDRCAAGYFGRPWPAEEPGRSPCRPCQCNNNIDPGDPAACDPRTGRCQRCLHHSHGPGCAHCRRCSCDPRGTVPARCPSWAEVCFCDPVNGQCPCRPHTVGRACSRCAPLFWNLGGPWGCEPCSCRAQHTLQPVCHPVTGQCPCWPGFGGCTCSRCEDGSWGDPERECRGLPLAQLRPSHGTAVTALAQSLMAPGQAVAQSEPWLERQCERLKELSRELDCVKGLAWPKRAPGVQEAEAQASSAALLSQEAVRGAQVVATVGGPGSLLGQAREARRWTERLLRGPGQPGGASVWVL